MCVSYAFVFSTLCRFNVREVFEIYRHESDPQKIDDLFLMGSRTLATLQLLAKLDEKVWAQFAADCNT